MSRNWRDSSSLEKSAHKLEWLLVLAVFLLAFVVRHHLLVTYKHPLMIHEQDAIGYLNVAKSILALRIPDVTGRPPGYPVVIALFSLVNNNLEYAARLASIFMDSLIVVPLFIVARIFLSKQGAVAAVILWVFFSFSLFFSTSPLSQSSYLFYLLSGIAFLHYAFETRGFGWSFGSGIIFALSYLARPEGIVGFASGLLLFLFVFAGRDGRTWRNALVMGYFLFGFLIVAFPYLFSLRCIYGYWTVSPLTEAHVKTADAILTLNSQGELTRTNSVGIMAWKEHYQTLPKFLETVKTNMLAFSTVYTRTLPVWMHVASSIGILAVLWRRRCFHFGLLFILLAVITPNFVVTIPKSPSYLYPLFAFTFICFVSCCEAVLTFILQNFRSIAGWRHTQVLFSCIMLLIASGTAYASYQDAVRNYESIDFAIEVMRTENVYKAAGDIIKNNSQRDDIIITRWGLLGYFADRPTIALPKGGVKDVVEYGRKNRARFLVIDTTSVFSRREELMELFAPLQGIPTKPEYGIEAVGSNFIPDIGGYVIYRYIR